MENANDVAKQYRIDHLQVTTRLPLFLKKKKNIFDIYKNKTRKVTGCATPGAMSSNF